MGEQIFLSPQVKRSLIISNKYGIYELPQKLNCSRSALFHMKTRVCLKYSMKGCLGKQFFAFNSPQAPSSLSFLTNFVIQRLLTLFQPKISVVKFKKAPKCVLAGNYSPDLFTEVQI